MIRLGDIAHVTRGPADPAQPMFRVNGREGIGLAIAMRKGGDVLALGRNVARGHDARSRRTCRSGSSRRWSPTSP